jgi:hypothetical protein
MISRPVRHHADADPPSRKAPICMLSREATAPNPSGREHQSTDRGHDARAELPVLIRPRFQSDNMILDWLDAAEAVAFAKEIAREVDLLFPLNPQKRRRASTKSDKKNRRKLDGLVRRTRAFAQSHKLNIYKKGKFLNALKWELREAGYEDSLIDEIVALLTPVLA